MSPSFSDCHTNEEKVEGLFQEYHTFDVGKPILMRALRVFPVHSMVQLAVKLGIASPKVQTGVVIEMPPSPSNILSLARNTDMVVLFPQD